MKKKAATLIYGNQLNYLDHLAPLSFFLKIPLIINDDQIAHVAKEYYPNINIQYVNNLNIHFFIVRNFDKIISCITQDHFDSNFQFHQDLLKKRISTIWCPHGNSDKGKSIPFFESLKNEKLVLVYGKKMIDILKEKKIFHLIHQTYEIGNYRLKYYKKFKFFFDKIIEKKIKKKLPQNNKTILYAPTWNDAENSSSFEKYTDLLLNDLPSKTNLIIKLHPNLFKNNELKIELLKIKYKKKNILFLDDFPLIYPLLNYIDIYLGDFSSIGYDFLYFKKPMFFLPSNNPQLDSDLFCCGHFIKNQKIYKNIENDITEKNTKQKMKNLYDYTFKCKTNIKELKKIIFNH